jgi:hypothetical protein
MMSRMLVRLKVHKKIKRQAKMLKTGSEISGRYIFDVE